MDMYRIMYKYKGTVYQSSRWYKSKEKAERIARMDGASSVIWIKRNKGDEELVYCFELAY
jgi:hypothetical protein